MNVRQTRSEFIFYLIVALIVTGVAAWGASVTTSVWLLLLFIIAGLAGVSSVCMFVYALIDIQKTLNSGIEEIYEPVDRDE